MIEATYGEFKDFVKNSMYDAYQKHDEVAWLLFDKTGRELVFTTESVHKQPNEELFEPLFAYQVSKFKYFRIGGDSTLFDLTWNRIDW
jgi:hypothetical protein